MEKTNQKEIRRDFDEAAIAFYQAYYNPDPARNSHDLKGSEDRFYQAGREWMYRHRDARISVRGDVCFNLRLQNGRYFSFFGSLLKDENEQVRKALFDSLELLLFAPMNLSLMPKKGALNNLKQAVGSDRFDTFAWLLDCYYKGVRVPILNGGAQNMCMENRLALRDFLDSYHSAAEYFRDIYGLDRDFVNELIASGKREITDKRGYYRYIGLAVRFWKKRLEQEAFGKYLQQTDKERYGKILNSIAALTVISETNAERRQEKRSRVILITGATHTGKTLLAQRLLERYGWPYLCIDHLKMGLIRSGQTELTPEDDEKLTDYLWPIVREIVKTAVENRQNLIVEGCYIPFDWRGDFDEQYLPSIRFLCLAMPEAYIDAHFDEIKARASDIESRLDDSGLSPEGLKRDNRAYIDGFRGCGEPVLLIEEDYEGTIKKLMNQMDAEDDP